MIGKTSRTFLLAALFVSMLIVSVAYRASHGGTRIGDRAPALTFESEPNDALRALRGKYVLLCFWSSTDAPSREAVDRYSAWIGKQHDSGIGLLAFNLDKSETLFREIVKRDGLNQQLQFHLSEKGTDRLLRDYGLKEGSYGTLLIAPDGRIVAHNPATGALPSLISAGQ